VSTVSSLVGVDAVPDTVRSLATVSGPDYVDLYTIEARAAGDHSPEEWARALLERAALSQRHARRLWRLMGLRLGPGGSPDHVAGWTIAARADDWIRLETGLWYATAQALCLVGDNQVRVSLFLRYDHPVARLVWRVVSGPHQRAVPVMLGQAVGLMSAGLPAGA
jgi:hypothetical protein